MLDRNIGNTKSKEIVIQAVPEEPHPHSESTSIPNDSHLAPAILQLLDLPQSVLLPEPAWSADDHVKNEPISKIVPIESPALPAPAAPIDIAQPEPVTEIIHYPNGDVYTGPLLHGKPQGHGNLVFTNNGENKSYSGEFN